MLPQPPASLSTEQRGQQRREEAPADVGCVLQVRLLHPPPPQLHHGPRHRQHLHLQGDQERSVCVIRAVFTLNVGV